MTIQQIYDKYQVPKNLQEHMLRTGALAQILLEKWHGNPIPKEDIILGCLLHDIAKPMTFDLAKQAQFGMAPKDIENLAALQQYLKQKYGTNEHEATVSICQEIGCSQTTLRIVNNMEWYFIDRLLKENDLASLILIYCDMRIGPNGILTMNDRINNLQSRTQINDVVQLIESGKKLENIVQEKLSIDVNSITNTDLNNLFELLKQISLDSGI